MQTIRMFLKHEKKLKNDENEELIKSRMDF